MKVSTTENQDTRNFELVDTTGRLVKTGKRGSIPETLSPILKRLNIKSESWVDTIATLSQSFSSFMGRPESLENCMVQLERPRMRGLKSALKIFSVRGRGLRVWCALNVFAEEVIKKCFEFGYFGLQPALNKMESF